MVEKRKSYEHINDRTKNIIKVAILAEEPLGWGSGKHYFPIILDKYNWKKNGMNYEFRTEYIYDKDIIQGKLNIKNFNVLLVPGGGVGDGEAIVKGFNIFRKVRRWKKNVTKFIKDGGGYVGICGGAALLTNLLTDTSPTTFAERQYNKSSLNISCVSSYYKNLAIPLFYPFQFRNPERIGATGYIFSFAAGETEDGKYIHAGGVPIDFKIIKNHPIFADFEGDELRIRWWGGPGLVVPEEPNRNLTILGKYPEKFLSEENKTKIYAWKYVGGIRGIFFAGIKSFTLIKENNYSLKNVFLYTFYLAGNWKKTNKIIDLNQSGKPCMTAEIYPNDNQARILLCSPHPEYMIWWGGLIEEVNDTEFNCLAKGLHQWKKIKSLSKSIENELTYTWWLVRRFVAWAAKVNDDNLPPISKDKIDWDIKSLLSENIFWDGSLINLMKNI